MEKFEKLEKDVHFIIGHFYLDEYEMHKRLSWLMLAFCKDNNVACLTSIKNNIIHYGFTISEHHIYHLYVDINLVLRKYKIKKLKK